MLTPVCSQIYRKAAFKIVQDLGEDVFPEPEPAKSEAAASASTDDSKTVEDHKPPSNAPPSDSESSKLSETPADSSTTAQERLVTTEERKPLMVPDSVHINIIPESLKDYVGPPVYYKDRMYGFAPPPGVSTGLGYLGNGSGAVMPIEATVSSFFKSLRVHN